MGFSLLQKLNYLLTFLVTTVLQLDSVSRDQL